jgi:TonB family protein
LRRDTMRSQGRLAITSGYLMFCVGCASLGAPRLISPEEGALLTFFPHVVDFQWAPVAAAARYRIEFDGYYCGNRGDQWCYDVNKRVARTHEVSAPKYTSNNELLGNQPWRWRVSAIDKHGRSGAPTPWRQIVFSQTRAPGRSAASFRDPVTGAAITGSGVSAPSAIYSPPAPYPRSALSERIGGQVLMDVVVDAEGRVQTARVIKSLRKDFDDSAIEAVKTWRFEPARRDGRAVPALITISMDFSVR